MIPTTVPQELSALAQINPELYRLNVVAMVIMDALDVARLDIYRRAVQAGFFSDEMQS